MTNEEFEDIRLLVRKFIREEVVPCETEIEDTDAIPEHLRQTAKDMGLFGFALPEEFGGLGLNMEREARLVFELGYTSPAFRSMFGTNNGIAGHVTMVGGTSQQKSELLPKIASGEWTASFALTEPEAGSNPAALVTTAVRDGGEYVINGQKRWITNSPLADVFYVFARTDVESTGATGISCILVEKNAVGMTIGPRDKKMGQAGAWTAEVFFDNVRVPVSNLIGEKEGDGYKIAMSCLAHGRIHVAALCVGAAQRLVDEMVEFAKNRKQGSQYISEHQLVQGLIADSVTDMYAARAIVLESARAFDAGSDLKIGPSAAKYFASEAVGRIADRAVQIHGGSGYMRGVPVERFYRDVRLFRIYEGTSQIMQVIIGRAALREFGLDN
jgi:acyl-CoA dehydrogenase